MYIYIPDLVSLRAEKPEFQYWSKSKQKVWNVCPKNTHRTLENFEEAGQPAAYCDAALSPLTALQRPKE